MSVQQGAPPDEFSHEAGCWSIVDIFWATDLLDRALVHDHNPIRQCEGLVLIVSDKERRHFEAADQRMEVFAKSHAQLRIQVREGLIEEQHFWLQRKRSRQRNALLLAARELAG